MATVYKYPSPHAKKIKRPNIVKDHSIEAPSTTYHLSAEQLVKFIQKAGGELATHSFFEKLFIDLLPYEDDTIIEEIESIEKSDSSSSEDSVHQTKPDFDEKIVKALFFVPETKRKEACYQYLKLRLAPSNIKKAGMGVYAIDTIPKGAMGIYKGVLRDEDSTNYYYSWTIKSFDERGERDEKDKILCYRDAGNPEESNWTRYVNCGLKNSDNNVDVEQTYDKIFYVITKTINPDEELFIDYGKYYRKENLGMKGKY